MVLHEPAETCHRKINAGTSERLPKLIRVSRKEIFDGIKEIHAIETVRYFGSQSDAIYSSADLPKMFAERARIGVAHLIVILATFAVPCIGPPEDNDPSNVNLRPTRFVCAQDGMARRGLKTQIANGLRTQDRCE